jgi:gluconate 2-dehydrogenase gamma chain
MNQRFRVTRRELLQRMGAAAVMPPRIFLPLVSPAGDPLPSLAQAPGGPVASTLDTLTGAEAEVLRAVTARLIPTDNNGPGATEARATEYIDRALGGALASFRENYRAGLAALDRYAQGAKGSPFARLSAADQDGILADLERNAANGFPQSSAFFNLVLAHTIQGTFCDPYYGGNANFVGWDLVGYPGVRLAVTSDEQKLNARPSPTHMSAYEYRMFSGRRPARAALDAADTHAPAVARQETDTAASGSRGDRHGD